MKVWVVIYQCNEEEDEREIRAVFASKEAAKAYTSNDPYFEIEVHEVIN